MILLSIDNIIRLSVGFNSFKIICSKVNQILHCDWLRERARFGNLTYCILAEKWFLAF